MRRLFQRGFRLAGLMVAAGPLFAGRVELTNHDVISGHLLGIKTGTVAWAADFGAGTLALPGEVIQSLQDEGRWAVTTTDGDRLAGVIRVESGQLVLNNALVGNVSLAWSQIISLEPASNSSPINPSPNSVATADGSRLTDESAMALRGRGDNSPVVGAEQQANAEPEAIQYAMRRSGYLLRKGESDLTTGLAYAHAKSNLPFPGIPESRNLNLPLDWRHGFGDRVEASLSLPIGWSSIRYDNGLREVHDSITGISDVAAGLRVMISPEKLHWPEIIAFAQQSFPTGADPDATNPYKPVLGTGHFSTVAGVSFLKASDPLVLVCNLSYNHPWNNWQSADYHLGDSFGFTLGLVFAINHESALGTEVNWRYQIGERLRVSNAKSADTEGAMSRIWLTYRINKSYLIEPYVRFGLTNSEGDQLEIGGNVIRRF